MTTEQNEEKQRKKKSVTHKGKNYHVYRDGRVSDENDTEVTDLKLVAAIIDAAYANDDSEPSVVTVHNTTLSTPMDSTEPNEG